MANSINPALTIIMKEITMAMIKKMKMTMKFIIGKIIIPKMIMFMKIIKSMITAKLEMTLIQILIIVIFIK